MPFRSAAKEEDPLEDVKRLESIECGREALEHFNIAEGYRNLNHGEYCSECHHDHSIEFPYDAH
jgi:hypothetical protein